MMTIPFIDGKIIKHVPVTTKQMIYIYINPNKSPFSYAFPMVLGDPLMIGRTPDLSRVVDSPLNIMTVVLAPCDRRLLKTVRFGQGLVAKRLNPLTLWLCQHSYGLNDHFEWDNPLFLWSFSIAM